MYEELNPFGRSNIIKCKVKLIDEETNSQSKEVVKPKNPTHSRHHFHRRRYSPDPFDLWRLRRKKTSEDYHNL
jgi:hypothetical protein